MNLKLIREARKREKLTQVELGSMVGVDGSQISRFENGKSRPRLDEAAKIAECLKLRLSDIHSEDTYSIMRPVESAKQTKMATLPLAEGTAFVEFPKALSEQSRKSLKLWLSAVVELVDT